jgi:hypothetical protein
LALTVILILAVSCTRHRSAGQQDVPSPRPQDNAGFLVLDCDADQATVILGGGPNTVELVAGEPPTRVVPGSYMPILCVLESKDADGVAWRASSSAGRPGNLVTVDPGETARLTCGPPFTARLSHARRGPTIVFRIAMTGQVGLSYGLSSIRRGNTAAPPPGIVLRNADDEEIARGTFRYG